MVSLRQIRYFIATASSGKISLAASDLNVSQSAISTAIKELEANLDTQLFERHASGVTLTYEGHQFLQHARNIASTVAEATRALSRSGRDVTGEVVVGVTYTVAGYFLPEILSRFHRAFPRVEIRMQELLRDQIERRLVDGRLDLAVMLVSNLWNSAEIESEVLAQSPRHLWVSADHHLTARDEVTLAEISREPYVMLTVDEAQTTALKYWEPTGYRPKTVFATSSVEAVRSMVALGTGVTVLSNMVYRPWSLEGRQVELRPVVDHVPSMDVGLAWHRGITLSDPARVFRDFMSRTFRGSRDGFVNADVFASRSISRKLER